MNKKEFQTIVKFLKKVKIPYKVDKRNQSLCSWNGETLNFDMACKPGQILHEIGHWLASNPKSRKDPQFDLTNYRRRDKSRSYSERIAAEETQALVADAMLALQLKAVPWKNVQRSLYDTLNYWNPIKSEKYFRCDFGHVNCKCPYQVKYFEGDSTKRDIIDALKWAKKNVPVNQRVKDKITDWLLDARLESEDELAGMQLVKNPTPALSIAFNYPSDAQEVLSLLQRRGYHLLSLTAQPDIGWLLKVTDVQTLDRWALDSLVEQYNGEVLRPMSFDPEWT